MSHLPSPRPLSEQVVVVTGASSGIGRAVALDVARRGAKVALLARNEEALSAVASEIRGLGGQALVVVCDVSDWEQVQRAAHLTAREFGGIDTWINNAAVSEYAYIEDQPIEDIERIMNVNVMGVIHGCKAALPYLKQRGVGQIINVGSGLSERSIPLQGVYCATKHAVKGFTEALRMEINERKEPIHVTLILPGVIDTPFYTSAKSLVGVRPSLIPPVYGPEVVSEAITFACETPRRDIFTGGAGKALAYMNHVSGPLTDKVMTAGGALFKLQASDTPDDGRSNLYQPTPGRGSVSGGNALHPIKVDPYTRYLELHPNRKRLLAAALFVGGLALLARRRA